jgi:hypothetical protein
MKLLQWYYDRCKDLLSWLFPVDLDFRVRLDRVQWQEREERKEHLAMELSTSDAVNCRARVKRRMSDGDSVWIPPRYGVAEAYRAWRSRHPRQRQQSPISIEEGRS